MSISRRTFVKGTAMAGGALGMGIGAPRIVGASETREEGAAERRPVEKARKPLDILVLGGTGFTGPHQVRYAVARGHKVTVFNRGRRQADIPKEVEHLIGDRNNDLKSLQGNRKWDVVIDVPTSIPVWVRDVGQVLKGRTNHYIYISSISAYGDSSKPGMDETTPVARYKGADPMKETQETLMKDVGNLYGPLKALSEAEAEKWFPGKVTVIRPGYIVGEGDTSDRFTYWPVRVERGGEMVVPGQPSDPVQFIDVRDLSEWIIRMAENTTYGIYNATGPRSELSMGEFIGGCRAVQPGSLVIKPTWIPNEFLETQRVGFPIYAPPTGEYAGFARVSVERAVAKGLTFRPLADTVQSTLAYWKSLPEDRRAKPRAFLPAEKEAEVLAAWKAKNPQTSSK